MTSFQKGILIVSIMVMLASFTVLGITVKGMVEENQAETITTEAQIEVFVKDINRLFKGEPLEDIEADWFVEKYADYDLTKVQSRAYSRVITLDMLNVELRQAYEKEPNKLGGLLTEIINEMEELGNDITLIESGE